MFSLLYELAALTLQSFLLIFVWLPRFISESESHALLSPEKTSFYNFTHTVQVVVSIQEQISLAFHILLVQIMISIKKRPHTHIGR